MRPVRVLLMTLAAGLAGAGTASAQAQDAALAKLEKNRAANPNSVAALRALGIRYFQLNRYQEARSVLDQARKLDPKDGTSVLYYGMASEQLKDMTAAKDAYSSYLQVGKTKKTREQVRTRLVALSKEDLKEAAKAAVANETAIASQPGSPNTIAVLPFTISVPGDTTLAPLSRGLADLVITDLGKANRVLKIVERDRIQAIADEIRLSQSTQVDQGTAVRAGKLIQAGRVLNSQLVGTGGLSVSMTGVLADTRTSQTGNVTGSSGNLDALFRMETDYVFSVLSSMSITLTAAERQAIQQKPTASLQAFMAYSRGLMAEDNGRLDDAARFYENARTADPGFGAALQRAQAAQQAQQGRLVSGATIEQSLKGSAEGQSVSAASNGSSTSIGNTSTLSAAAGDVNPSLTTTVSAGTTGAAPTGPRPATAETSGTSQPVQTTGQVTITLKRP